MFGVIWITIPTLQINLGNNANMEVMSCLVQEDMHSPSTLVYYTWKNSKVTHAEEYTATLYFIILTARLMQMSINFNVIVTETSEHCFITMLKGQTQYFSKSK